MHTALTTVLVTDDLIFSKLETGRWPTLQVRTRVRLHPAPRPWTTHIVHCASTQELSQSLSAFGLDELAA